jgi:xylan 1,4-beta-xylosidase
MVLPVLRHPAAILALLTAAIAHLPASAQSEPRPAHGLSTRTWTADNGDGTFTNPVFYDEFSDPDIIRVGDWFYLTGTTRCPACRCCARRTW